MSVIHKRAIERRMSLPPPFHQKQTTPRLTNFSLNDEMTVCSLQSGVYEKELSDDDYDDVIEPVTPNSQIGRSPLSKQEGRVNLQVAHGPDKDAPSEADP